MASSRVMSMMDIDPELLAMDSPGAGPSRYNPAFTAATAYRYDADNDDEVDELDYASAFLSSRPIAPEDEGGGFGRSDSGDGPSSHAGFGLPRSPQARIAQGSRDLAGQTEDDVVGDDDVDQDEVFDRFAGMISHQNEDGAAGPSRFRNEIEALGHRDGDEDALASSGPSRRHGGPSTQRKKVRRRTAPVHKPTHEVNALLGQANFKVICGDLNGAIPDFLEVIRLDSHVLAAWTALSSCYDQLGRDEEALQIRFCAAHLENDPTAWRDLADRFKAAGQVGSATYCVTRVLKHDPKDVATIYELAELYRHDGRANKVVDQVKKIIKFETSYTHDLAFLLEFHPYMVEANQIRFAAQAFRAAFDFHYSTFASPDDAAARGSGSAIMGVEHVVVLVDLLLQLESLEEALLIARRGQRWVQGRKTQKGWDSIVDDDREYDPPGYDRDAPPVDFVDKTYQMEGHELDLNLRHRLALIRLRLGHQAEAMIHVEEILELDVEQHHALIRELGGELLNRKMWPNALNCYAVVHSCPSVEDDPQMIYAISICQYEMGNLSAAVESLRFVVENEPENVEARLKLAKVLEEQGKKAEALEIVGDVLKRRVRGGRGAATEKRRPEAEELFLTLDETFTPPAVSATPGSKPSKADQKATRRLTKKVLEDQMRERMDGLWTQVHLAEEGIAEGQPGALDQFIFAAGTMIETFRLARRNFGKNRGVVRVPKGRKAAAKPDLDTQALELQDRLERTLGIEDETLPEHDPDGPYYVLRQTEWYGQDCETWLQLVVKYCCVLMVKNEEDAAMDILEHVVWAGLFNNVRSEVALRMCIIACAMRTRSYDAIADNCRRLAQLHQFRAEPFLLMLAAMGGGGSRAAAVWSKTPLSRFIHRELRLADEAVSGIKMSFNKRNRRWNQVSVVGLSRRLGDDLGDDEPEEEEGGGGAGAGAGAGDDHDSQAPESRAASRDGAALADGQDDEPDEEDDGLPLGAEAGMDTEDTGGPIPKPTVPSPYLNAIYGQYMLTQKSYQSALFYLFRAYEVDQYNAFLCLSIAQAFFGRSMNRQVDNRNYMIAQGMMFLVRYRKLSPKDEITREEIEYNFGRSFHAIGVLHLAVEHYERVLALVKGRMAVSEDPEAVREGSLAYEAAHNLMLIYASSGSNELAQRVSKWLAI